MTTCALVLARGLGRRMQQPDGSATLSRDQQRAADAGHKAMMPVGGRPFLDFVLGALADAGLTDVGLIVAPNHNGIRNYYSRHFPRRVRLTFVIQDEALGTANAALAGERFVSGRSFVVVNADNLYPADVLQLLAALDEPGLAAFKRDEIVQSSNIPDERVQSFALIAVDDDGYLREIIEKPAAADFEKAGASALVSMNCWRLNPSMFRFCREVSRSPRGEFELPEAVGLALENGVKFRAVPGHGPVLDLSRRTDPIEVAERLSGVTPRP